MYIARMRTPALTHEGGQTIVVTEANVPLGVDIWTVVRSEQRPALKPPDGVS